MVKYKNEERDRNREDNTDGGKVKGGAERAAQESQKDVSLVEHASMVLLV